MALCLFLRPQMSQSLDLSTIARHLKSKGYRLTLLGTKRCNHSKALRRELKKKTIKQLIATTQDRIQEVLAQVEDIPVEQVLDFEAFLKTRPSRSKLITHIWGARAKIAPPCQEYFLRNKLIVLFNYIYRGNPHEKKFLYHYFISLHSKLYCHLFTQIQLDIIKGLIN